MLKSKHDLIDWTVFNHSYVHRVNSAPKQPFKGAVDEIQHVTDSLEEKMQFIHRESNLSRLDEKQASQPRDHME